MKNLSTREAGPHMKNIHGELQKLAGHLERDIRKVDDEKAKEHFKVACEIVKELARSFEEYEPKAQAA